jgi:hypothetical protein
MVSSQVVTRVISSAVRQIDDSKPYLIFWVGLSMLGIKRLMRVIQTTEAPHEHF